MIHLIIATRNAHKVREIASILGKSFHCLPMTCIEDAPDLAERGSTFEENATGKAKQLASWLADRPRARDSVHSTEGVFVVADDSGLEVNELDGAPGVHSARFAVANSGTSGNSKDEDNNAKLIRLLKDVPPKKRTARFRCVLAMMPLRRGARGGSPPSRELSRGPGVKLFEGVCDGRLLVTVRGVGGFGYDPLFVPKGYRLTFGELGEPVKSRISHRARALEKLKRHLLKQR